MSFLNIVQSIFLKTFILFIVITYCTCKYKINVTYRIISDKWLTAPEFRSWDHAILHVALDNAC